MRYRLSTLQIVIGEGIDFGDIIFLLIN